MEVVCLGGDCVEMMIHFRQHFISVVRYLRGLCCSSYGQHRTPFLNSLAVVDWRISSVFIFGPTPSPADAKQFIAEIFPIRVSPKCAARTAFFTVSLCQDSPLPRTGMLAATLVVSVNNRNNSIW